MEESFSLSKLNESSTIKFDLTQIINKDSSLKENLFDGNSEEKV